MVIVVIILIKANIDYAIYGYYIRSLRNKNWCPEEGELFTFPARGLKQVRDERRATIQDRCEKVADIINSTTDYAVVWCNLNDEGDLLEKMIPDSIQVSGKDKDERKKKLYIVGQYPPNEQDSKYINFLKKKTEST